MGSIRASVARPERSMLTLATLAVAFAAADTYVVALALPDMMITVGLGVDQLQRAAPIISGFLLGYVAMLPLIGRIADVRGRVPVLTGSLVVFAFGSLITALAFDLPSVVTGRFLQGVGGGGLVPATLALVADLYPAERRAVPLGIVSAVQEIGSVIGPLYGAVILSVTRWEAIFWINLAVGLVLAVAIDRRGRQRSPDPVTMPDPLSVLLLALTLAGLILLLWEPEALISSVQWGGPFVPVTGTSRWLSPVAFVVVGLFAALVVRTLTAKRPLIDLRSWARTFREADALGATILAVALGGVILAFATADPQIQLFSPIGPYLLGLSVVAAVLFVVHLRRTERPLVPPGALRERPAWGGLVVSFFIGAALIAALIDIPVFARLTVYRDSQLDAALVLLRLLIAVPIGALLGGYAVRRISAGIVTAIGMAFATAGFVLMAQWGAHSLNHVVLVTGPLLLTGLGFGLALAPVNAAVLANTADEVHGLASALVVVARMIGMLVGISALTALGLRRYFEELRPHHELAAAITQVHVIFTGAAVCAAVAGVLSLVLFTDRRR